MGISSGSVTSIRTSYGNSAAERGHEGGIVSVSEIRKTAAAIVTWWGPVMVKAKPSRTSKGPMARLPA